MYLLLFVKGRQMNFLFYGLIKYYCIVLKLSSEAKLNTDDEDDELMLNVLRCHETY